MIRQSIRSSKSLALSFALGVIAVAGVAGCGASEQGSDDPIVTQDVQNERVTPESLAALPDGEFLSLDMTEKTVYAIDYSAGPIDYARIKLTAADGKEISLEQQMATVENGTYGDNPAPQLRESSEQRFSIASDAAYFNKLSESELDQLKADGYFYSEKAPEGYPGAGPQTTDPECIHAFCEICVDNTTGGRPETWYPGTYTCYLVEHVWC
ncbi:hypothetical protein SOCE26_007640 [Sorangium cellulosum]|uniref:Secreted protein n=1 Tax=Sorangium cellulosum TaxID=56 RepID=A0A2L0EJ99_SORCE|nr:hypothetical protein [Sorangium cellulosum]AUX39375.1 hypothetical protein SOCE26_007640 [Sorangium cellulosum]